jgi:hypothetical protein
VKNLVFILLLILTSYCCAELIQYCTNSPQSHVGSDGQHYAQVITPSFNEGTIQTVEVHTSYFGSSLYLSRSHRIELWRFDGEAPYHKFYDHSVNVELGSFVGWWSTTTAMEWSGGTEDSFLVVFQSRQVGQGSIGTITSLIGYDGEILEPNRNWIANSNNVWNQSTIGDYMFRVTFNPVNECITPVTVGSLKSIYE